jgi:hypothetical protein
MGGNNLPYIRSLSSQLTNPELDDQRTRDGKTQKNRVFLKGFIKIFIKPEDTLVFLFPYFVA